MSNIFSRLVDANIYVLNIPTEGNDTLLLATIHPFDLDGNGYELRVYRLKPKRVELSPTALAQANSGWGIEEVSCESGSVVISRDSEFWIRITASVPCEVELKRKLLREHPDDDDEHIPSAVLDLASSSTSWESYRVERCDGA